MLRDTCGVLDASRAAAEPAGDDPMFGLCETAGGRGAVREVCQAILTARGEWKTVVERMQQRD